MPVPLGYIASIISHTVISCQEIAIAAGLEQHFLAQTTFSYAWGTSESISNNNIRVEEWIHTKLSDDSNVIHL